MTKKGIITKLVTYFFVLFIMMGMFSATDVKAAGINKSTATIYVGGPTLKIKVSGTTAKTWRSSKKSVATVSQKGLVTAKAPGITKITCKCKNGKAYTCKIVVKEPYLNTTAKEIHAGKAFTLKLIGVKVKGYNSADSSIARVSKEGLITGNKAGTTQVTVKGENGKTYSCEVTVTRHQKVSSQNEKEPTCTEAGKKSDTECSICGKLLSKGEEIPATGHVMVSTIVKYATCAEKGKLKSYCIICNGNEGYEELPTTNHAMVSTIVKYATCAEKGKIKSYCTKCNGNEGYEEIPATGHEAGECIRQNASCTKNGKEEVYCTKCYECISSKELPAVGHNWIRDEEMGVEPATCARGTTTYYKCTKCYDQKTEVQDDQKEHRFATTFEEKLSCVSDGYILQQCELCNEYREERPKALGHDYEMSADKKAIVCNNCRSTFTAALSTSVKEGKYYTLPYGNVAIGQQLTIDGEVVSQAIYSGDQLVQPGYEYYEYNRMYADFWSHMRVESSNTDSVDILKHDYQTGYVINPVETVNLDQQDVLRMYNSGKSHVKIYFYDILYDEFDVYVGALIVDGIKAAMDGQLNEELFGGYSDLQKTNVTEVAAMLKATINDSMSDYQKVNAIKAWYKENVSYEHTGADADSISEIFLNKQGQCEDYAETFSLLMDVLGIENYYIVGTVPPAELGSNNHAWNIVKLDAGNGKGSQWYYVDMTWDQFDTDYTVLELNERDGAGKYIKGATNSRIAEYYRKLRQSDYSNDTQPFVNEENQGGMKSFSDFQY